MKETGVHASNGAARVPPKPWESVLNDGWANAALVAYACVAVAILAWGAAHPSWLETLMMSAEDPTPRLSHATQRRALLLHVMIAAPFALAAALYVLYRERKNAAPLPTYWAPAVIASIALPLAARPMFEYRYPVFTGLMMLGFGLSIGYAASGFVRTLNWRPRELSARTAWWIVGAAFVLFTAWMGGMAHWRFITFHAEPYDMSWETNAVHNIVHTGIPRISVGAGAFYPGKLLPANYADTHTPWIYYLYAPFYAVFQDGRTLLWLQAAFMGAGVIGAYLFARRWLNSHLLGAIFGVAYVMNPHVQTYCLHDVHANPIAIPMVLLALGMMELRRPYWALFFAFLTCITREETSVYAVALGLFWALGPARDRVRMRIGWLTLLMGTALLLFITQGVMVWAGGKPRYSHFTFYFDSVGIGGVLKSYVLNPLGALKLLSSPMRMEYLWLALLPYGFLAGFGWRAAWFLLVPMGLLFPARSGNFWVAGMNYSAPIAAPALIMSVFGARYWLLRATNTDSFALWRRRVGLAGFLLTLVVSAGLLYGNIFGKTYKYEFGAVPFRQSNHYDYIGELGLLETMPPYGERERLLWDLIERVPQGVPIATSWRINPQLSNRTVSLLYPEDGSNHPSENLARYIVIDRLPPMALPTENHERSLRANPAFRVFYENKFGVIFERK